NFPKYIIPHGGEPGQCFVELRDEHALAIALMGKEAHDLPGRDLILNQVVGCKKLGIASMRPLKTVSVACRTKRCGKHLSDDRLGYWQLTPIYVLTSPTKFSNGNITRENGTTTLFKRDSEAVCNDGERCYTGSDSKALSGT